MPVAYTEKLWRSLYAMQVGDPGAPDHGEWVSYGRRWWELGNRRRFERRAETLIELGVSGRVLVVGCAYGYLVEQLVDRGLDGCGIDASPYVRATLADEARPDIAQRITFESVEAHDGVYDWVIDEDALPGYAPEEAPAFLDACDRLASGPDHVVHIVSTLRGKPGDSALTWLTADAWRAMRPSHTWLADG